MSLLHAQRVGNLLVPAAARGGHDWTIDWQHPLTSGLVGYWLPSALAPGGGLLNLVSGRRAAPNGGQQPQGVGCRGLYYQTAGGGGVFANGVEDLGSQDAATIACSVGVTTLTTGIGLFSARSGGTRRNSLSFTGSNRTPRYEVNYGSITNIDDTTDRIGAVGDAITLTGTTRTRTDHELWVDGVSRATSTASCGGASVGSRNQIIIGQRGGGDGVNNALWYWVAVWSRGFSTADAAALARDPYGFLIPPRWSR